MTPSLLQRLEASSNKVQVQVKPPGNLHGSEAITIGMFTKKESCAACETKFGSQKELMEHAATAHAKGPAKAPALSCKACGTAFNSKPEMDAHGKKAHAM